jgi:DNA polymerase III gamma/tau subunit
LAGKPLVGQYKVAILNNMDEANVQMANSLLKTLEEPSPSTILILIARPNSLLPTIVSRCQVINFNSASVENNISDDPEQIAQLEKALQGNISDRLMLVNQLAELESGEISEILLAWLYRQRAQLAKEPQRAKTMARIMEALPALAGSFNKKMVLQRLLLT